MMKTRYKHLHFVNAAGEWECRTNLVDCVIGTIPTGWKQKCYLPLEDTVYGTNWLQDIIHFLNQLNGTENKS